MTHWRSDSVALSCCWMSGSATLTIVMSSRSMNTPVQTAARVHHLGSRPVSALATSVLMSPLVAGVPIRLRPGAVPSPSGRGLELAVQLERRGPVLLLDLVRRVLGRPDSRHANSVEPPDHRSRMYGAHGPLDHAAVPTPRHDRADRDAHTHS